MKRREILPLIAFAGALPNIGKAVSEEPIFGHGDFRYRQVKGWGTPADKSKVPVKDCHEMIMDKKKQLYLLTNHVKNNMIIYNKDGKIINTWTHKWSQAHGLTYVNENGEEFLFITDFSLGQVFKTTLDGKIIMTVNYPQETGHYKNKNKYRPTEVAVNPVNGDFYVSDGYGSQFVIHYNSKGEILNSFGGWGRDDGKFLNVHGVCFDDRNKKKPTLLLTCRHMFKFKRFSLDGKYIEDIPVPGASISRPVINGTDLYTAVLVSQNKWNSRSGYVAILDKDNKVISVPGGDEPKYTNGTCEILKQSTSAKDIFIHPHDVCVDDDKNIYIPQFDSNKTYPLKLERI